MKVMMKCVNLALADAQDPEKPVTKIATLRRQNVEEDEEVQIVEKLDQEESLGPVFEIGKNYFVEVTAVPGR